MAITTLGLAHATTSGEEASRLVPSSKALLRTEYGKWKRQSEASSPAVISAALSSQRLPLQCPRSGKIGLHHAPRSRKPQVAFVVAKGLSQSL
jgi:hypothetical protein